MTTLDVAKQYLKLGWQPIPIPHRSKNPNLSGWQKLRFTESELANHFNGKPQNIGVLLGEASNGLTDIDLDSPEAVKIADYFLPETKAVFGRNGKPRSHRLYLCTNGKFEKFNNPFLISSKIESERKQACIVELRTGDGLQTVFPGSTHESGEAVSWQSDGEPLQVDALKLRRAVACLASACLISTFWRNGMRNEINLALSGALLRNGFDLAETKNFIRAVGAAANDEEITKRMTAIDATAQKLESNEKVCGFPKLAELTDKKLVETVCKWLEINHRQESQNDQTETPGEFIGEPKPLDLTLKPVETIDDDCLPQVLVNWLRPASKVIGCPIDFLVLSAIIMVATLIGSRLRVKPHQHSDWFVVPNLYAGLVGLPSTKKTPALIETRKPILEFQFKASEDFDKLLKDYELDLKFYEKDSHKILKESATKEDYKRNIADCPQPAKPIKRRFETNDITASKLIQFLSENPIGMMLFRDELTGWLKSLEADYDKSSRPFFLELWTGAINYEMARVDGREIQLKSGTLSIIGGVQPSKLQRYVTEAYSFDNSDGFLQRFLFAYPDVWKRTGKPTKAEYDAMLKGYAKANEVLKQVVERDFKGKVIGANGDKFHIVKFDSEAQEVVDKWQDEIEDEAESLQIEDEAFSSFLYKLPKSCFAIALVFHCIETISKGSFSDEITIETALKAIAYTEVLISHARRVFALGENQIYSLAQVLIGKIKKGELAPGFKARDVMRKQWSGLRLKETVQDVLKLLADYNYLRELQTSGEGRPTTLYFVHPSLIKENEDENELEK